MRSCSSTNIAMRDAEWYILDMWSYATHTLALLASFERSVCQRAISSPAPGACSAASVRWAAANFAKGGADGPMSCLR